MGYGHVSPSRVAVVPVLFTSLLRRRRRRRRLRRRADFLGLESWLMAMGNLISAVVTHIAPVFIVTSPITSYGDQIYAMHRSRSSAGFSLDIPLIMLVASILKVFYWFGAHYSTALLLQALLMIAVHLVLLHVALTHRPAVPSAPLPFQHSAPSTRPYAFWQWRAPRPYWAFISYFAGLLLVLHLLLVSSTALFLPYTNALGVVALAIEATLPLPQLLANWQRRGCLGFRPSIIVNWVLGDTFKMWFFFASPDGEVPWAFKACGIFQACCDLGLAAQYLVWRDGPLGVDAASRPKEMRSPLPEYDTSTTDDAVSGAVQLEDATLWGRLRAT